MSLPSRHHSPLTSAIDILYTARDQIAALAESVGIDGYLLLQQLPSPGQLCYGNNVPVINPGYRGRCYVLFYVNETRNGQTWPWLRFYTFRHGGASQTFNGLRWLNHQYPIHGGSALNPGTHSAHSSVRIRAQNTVTDDSYRLSRHRRLLNEYKSGSAITINHPWVRHRLHGFATPLLLNRVAMRTHHHRILIPFGNHDNPVRGFQLQQLSGDGRIKKYMFVPKSGMKQGSYILIKSTKGDKSPVALCEGLSTGLAIATNWPGEIRVALDAGNLKAVRQTIDNDCIFFTDSDRWKPHTGNIGLDKARLAAQPRDILCVPEFSQETYQLLPTDFNDVLRLQGQGGLNSQIWSELNHAKTLSDWL